MRTDGQARGLRPFSASVNQANHEKPSEHITSALCGQHATLLIPMGSYDQQ